MEQKQRQPATETRNDHPSEKDIKINPNPAANGNIPEDEQKESKNQDKGVGSEITDGEAG